MEEWDDTVVLICKNGDGIGKSKVKLGLGRRNFCLCIHVALIFVYHNIQLYNKTTTRENTDHDEDDGVAWPKFGSKFSRACKERTGEEKRKMRERELNKLAMIPLSQKWHWGCGRNCILWVV